MLDFDELKISGLVEQPEEQSNDLLDLLKKRKESNQKESAMALIASGAAELLSGDTGGSIAKYGQGLAMDRFKAGEKAEDSIGKYSMAQDLAKFKASLKKGGDSVKPSLKSVFDPRTGKTVYKWIMGPNQASVPTNEVVGYSPKQIEGQEGQIYIASPAAGASGIREFKESLPEAEKGISPYFRKRSDKLADDFYSSTKKDRETIKDALTGYRQLMSEGIMPKKAALNNIVKLSEGGRMTDEDRQFILGAVGKIDQLKEAAKEASSGELRQRKINEAKELYKQIIEVNVAYLQDIAEGFAKSARSDREKQYLMNKMKKGLLEVE